MPQRKIFISHSSRKQHVQLLRDTGTALLAKSDGVLDYSLSYDQNGEIVAGDDWYAHIDTWMLDCHAAVILFSRRALYVSDWVKKEAAVLSWRHALDSGFKLIPVLLDGLKADDLKRGLEGVIRIVDKAQCIDVGNDAEAIATAVDAALRKDPAFTNYEAPANDRVGEPVEGLITSILTEIDRPLLGPVAGSLGGEPPTWPPDEHVRNARAVTRYLLVDKNASLQRFIDTLDRLPTLKADRARLLHHYIGCMWVSRDAASSIPAVRFDERSVAMSCPYAEFVPDRYVERAWPLTRLAKVVRVNQTSHDLALAKQEIEAEFTTPGRPLPPPVLKTKIENYSGPIVVLLPLALRHLLAALKNEYGGMIFVVVCDCEVPDTVSAVMPAVSPAASIDTINLQYAKYSEAEELVNGRS